MQSPCRRRQLIANQISPSSGTSSPAMSRSSGRLTAAAWTENSQRASARYLDDNARRTSLEPSRLVTVFILTVVAVMRAPAASRSAIAASGRTVTAIWTRASLATSLVGEFAINVYARTARFDSPGGDTRIESATSPNIRMNITSQTAARPPRDIGTTIRMNVRAHDAPLTIAASSAPAVTRLQECPA